MLRITDNGNSEYVIIIRKNHSASEKTAAEELAAYLKKITDAEIPVKTDDEKKTDHEIVIGFTNRGGKGKKELGEEGFTIKTEGKRLFILGSEVRGALYGVYSFLEKCCGCRFYTDTCERVPKVNMLTVPEIDCTELPGFEYRNVYWFAQGGEMISAKLKNNGGMGHELTERVGGGINYIGSFCHTFPDLGETGNVWDMPCLSDEAMYQTVLKNVRKRLIENPLLKIISVSQVDGNNGECSCEKCRKVFEEEKSHAGTLIRFCNRLQEDVNKEFEGVHIDTLAYRYTRQPPAVTKPHKDMIVRLCNIECSVSKPLEEAVNDPAENGYDNFPTNLKKWHEITNHLYIWDYTTNFTNMSTSFPNFNAIRKNVRFFKENGISGVFEQGNCSCLNGEFGELRGYLLAKLLWNPYMTESEFRVHMADFCTDYYGAAAKHMMQYIDFEHECLHDIFMTIYFDDSSNIIYMDGYKDHSEGAFAFYDKAARIFDEAEAAAWGSGNRTHYDNVRRSRIQLYNYNYFILKRKMDSANPEEKEALERASAESNRTMFALMREYGFTEPREFSHLDLASVPDFNQCFIHW